MADEKKKVNTIKAIGKKVANNGNADDYVYTPIGADSDNVDRPDGSTVEDSLVKVETEKVEIIPVESLPESEIKIYPYVYALITPNESKGIFYEYRNERWIKYGNGSDGIWVGTKEQCVQDFDNIEKGTIVIIVNKKEDSGETHTHDYVCQITKEPTYSQKGLKTCTCFLCGESYTEEIPALIDSIKPAGVIRIGENEYSSWKDNISFNTYYKDNQTVTIEATDNETGVKEIAYHLANTSISDSSIGSITWTTYTDPFIIQPNDNYIVYVKITDNADNVTYICSDGIVMDNIPPVFDGLEDGGTYPTGTVLTVEDGAVLTVNGEVVELTNRSYTFSEPMDNCRLSLSDRAGNVNSIIIVIEESKEREFEITKDNCYMAGINSLSDDITIPEKFEYDGTRYTITSIGNSAFSKCNELISVNIPNTVTEIKDDAFNLCEELTEINLPNNLNSIGTWVFGGCTKLRTVRNITYINKGMFGGCINLESIELNNNVTCILNGQNIIPESFCSGCCNLKSINIPRSIEGISIFAFENCNNLTITIPETVSFIYGMAFQNVKHVYYTGTATGSPWGALAIN